MSKLIFASLLLLVSFGGLFATNEPTQFFVRTNRLLAEYVQNGRIDYNGIQANPDFSALIKEIAGTEVNTLKGNDRKAYLINAYNLLVIDQVLKNYPLSSVLDVNGFFDAKKQTVGGKQLTLNQLEKEVLFKEFPDARLHFVLVCGAVGCPPITNFAYVPAALEAQLEKQTTSALNDNDFIRVNGTTAELSQIFNWYAKDFGGNNTAVLSFINKYRKEALPSSANITYYIYDWTLNKSQGRSEVSPANAADPFSLPGGGGNNSARYVVSSAIPQGSFEIKIFNNLYSQEAGRERSSFFTSTTSVLYGLVNRINVGFDLRYRRVRYDEAGTANNFDVFNRNGASSFRSVVSGFGPKVRIAPVESLPNFSIQSALWLPTADDLSGAENGERFTDFTGAIWFTQVFNDFSIGRNFSVFAEVDIVLEDIGKQENGRINRFSTPVTGIISYFPTPKTTLYGLASYSPFWQENFDYFYQLGTGVKYQFTPKFEVELLATAFDNQFLNSVNGNAGTVNLGLRFNL